MARTEPRHSGPVTLCFADGLPTAPREHRAPHVSSTAYRLATLHVLRRNAHPVSERSREIVAEVKIEPDELCGNDMRRLRHLAHSHWMNRTLPPRHELRNLSNTDQNRFWPVHSRAPNSQDRTCNSHQLPKKPRALWNACHYASTDSRRRNS